MGTVRRIISTLSVAVLAGAACAGTDAADDDQLSDRTQPPAEEPALADALGADEWTAVAAAPLEVTENDTEAFAGEVWTVGGFIDDGTVTTAVNVYDPSADTWRPGPDLPEPLHHGRLVSTGEELYLIGGYHDVAFTPIDEVLVLSGDGESWEPAPSLPEPRGAGGGAWDGERILYAGGVGPDGLADEVWAFDPGSGEWSDVGELSVARDHLDAASDGEGSTWFLAGRQMSLDANVGTVDLVVGSEVENLGELPTPRGGVGAFYSPAHGGCAAGGEETESTFDQVECIDADGATTELPALGVGRHGLGAAVVDGVAYVGMGGPEPMLAVSGILDALILDD